MTSYSSRLDRHLKNQARKLRQVGEITNQQALECVAIDFGFTGWKQACQHMAWSDAKIRETESTLSQEIANFSPRLRENVGYPYVADERLGIRYIPGETLHVEKVAKCLVYLRLYEQVHAPEHLNRTANAKLWFLPVLPLEDAESQVAMGRMNLRSLGATLINPTAPSAFPREQAPLTPEFVQERVLAYLHGLHSVSLIRCLSGQPESALEHPNFKAFASYALAGLQAHSQFSEVISFAGMSRWAQRGPDRFRPDLLLWEERSAGQDKKPAATKPLVSPTEQANRPPNLLTQDQHRRIAETLHVLEPLLPKQPDLRKRLEVIQTILAGWFAAEYGSPESAVAVYFKGARTYGDTAFLAPAEERRALRCLRELRQWIMEGYAQCAPLSLLLQTLSALDFALGQWLERTRHHWKKSNLKVLMDSIGLVAVDPKHDVLLEEESNWKRTDLMGTNWENSLVASVRHHLFSTWREEDELEGYAFDEASDETDASLMEHLHGLAFYRYVGAASTAAEFKRDAQRAFYFGVELAWFKQKLLRA